MAKKTATAESTMVPKTRSATWMGVYFKTSSPLEKNAAIIFMQVWNSRGSFQFTDAVLFELNFDD